VSKLDLRQSNCINLPLKEIQSFFNLLPQKPCSYMAVLVICFGDQDFAADLSHYVNGY